MDFSLDARQQELRASARAFGLELARGAAERDRQHAFPRAALAEVARRGWMGLAVPEEFGGLGLPTLTQCLILEELARGDVSLHVTVSVHGSLGCGPIVRWGSAAQQRAFLPGLASGERLGAYALTEPGSGSDAAALKTTAHRDGNHWRLDGAKLWITSGGSADTFIVFARTDAQASKAKGISAFIVDGNTPGFTRGKPEQKLGLRSSETTALFFDGALIPAENLLGEPGRGFTYAMSTLDAGRIGIATQSVGIAQAALDAALAGAPKAQAADFRLADMAARTEAARLLVWRAAALKDAGEVHATEASMAKLFASEAANRNCRDALEVLGPAAYEEGVAERLFRDARVTEIYEGTSEVQRLVIARGLRSG